MGSAATTALGELTLNVQGNAFAVSGSGTAASELQFQYDPATDWTDGLAVSVSLILPPAPAPTLVPASADVLVSNLGKSSRSGGSGVRNFVTGQTFTTGSWDLGYLLRSIDVEMNVNETVQGKSITDGQRATIRAELWSADSNGKPLHKLYDLVPPTKYKFGTEVHVLAAPLNARLNANTDYSVLWYSSNGGIPNGVSVRGTKLHGHDTAGSGWSIADGGFYKSGNSPAGGGYQTGFRVKIRVNGEPVPATVTLSASPTTVWEGQASRVTATLSHALPHGVLIPVTVTPCPRGAGASVSTAIPSISRPAAPSATSGARSDPNAAVLTKVVVDGGYNEHDRFIGTQTRFVRGSPDLAPHRAGRGRRGRGGHGRAGEQLAEERAGGQQDLAEDHGPGTRTAWP